MDLKAVNQVVTDQYAIYEGDSCELMQAIPADKIGYSVHSPPFEGLYKFSNSDRDVSNSEGEKFYEHYGFIIDQLLRITKPGRLASVPASTNCCSAEVAVFVRPPTKCKKPKP